jgi:predicted RNase H-like HicB family nuclease
MNMNAKSLITALLLTVSATGAFAQEFVQPDAGFVSTKTRAEVLQELAEANAAGTSSVAMKDSDYPVTAASPAATAQAKTRAEVLAELKEYNRENPRGYLYSYYFGH